MSENVWRWNDGLIDSYKRKGLGMARGGWWDAGMGMELRRLDIQIF